MNELQRLVGVFWEPRPVFEDLAARPRWWTPLILLTVLALIFTIFFSRVVGCETFMRRQLESNTRLQQLPPEKLEDLLAQQTKFVSITAYLGACAGVTLTTAVV